MSLDIAKTDAFQYPDWETFLLRWKRNKEIILMEQIIASETDFD